MRWDDLIYRTQTHTREMLDVKIIHLLKYYLMDTKGSRFGFFLFYYKSGGWTCLKPHLHTCQRDVILYFDLEIQIQGCIFLLWAGEVLSTQIIALILLFWLWFS